MIARTIKKM